ncbi:MAG: SAM-dependent methyltransferase [Myxococcales bacterium]|nr:SAM-dependent methyltransferase [Myxococcales bacterium]
MVATVTLGPRLAAVAALVPRGVAVADIGTDHALLVAALLADGHAPRAIACDLREGPLAAAQRTLARAQVEDRAALRRGDGLLVLTPGEVEAVVIAGMGARRIVELLAAAPAQLSALDHLVLQPNGPCPALRQFLDERGFQICDELVARERKHYYVALRARPRRTPGPRLDAIDRHVGPRLRRRRDPLVRSYCAHELARCDRALAGVASALDPDPVALAAFQERRAALAAALADASSP